MFYNCSTLKCLPDISKWDIANIKEIIMLFAKCSSLLDIPDISKWDIRNVSDMSGLFLGCLSLKYLLYQIFQNGIQYKS